MDVKITLLATLSLGLLGLTGCTSSAAPGCEGLDVSNAWVREAPKSASVQGAYFMLKNTGRDKVVVKSVTSPDFDRVEMHQTVTNNGSTTMKPLAEIDLPPGAEAAFAAGGKHLMLFGPHRPLSGGDRVQLQFICGKAREQLPISAQVRSGAPMAEHAHK